MFQQKNARGNERVHLTDGAIFVQKRVFGVDGAELYTEVEGLEYDPKRLAIPITGEQLGSAFGSSLGNLIDEEASSNVFAQVAISSSIKTAVENAGEFLHNAAFLSSSTYAPLGNTDTLEIGFDFAVDDRLPRPP